MRRCFNSSSENQVMSCLKSQFTGDEIGSIINSALTEFSLPVAAPLRVEALYLFDCIQSGSLNEKETKQSVSRGINWLGQHPISTPDILQKIFSNYWEEKETARPNYQEQMNDQVLALLRYVQKILSDRVPDYRMTSDSDILGDILTNWQYVWKEKAVYDALSCIAFVCEPLKPFDCFSAICILREIDRAAWRQWCAA